MAQQKEAPWWTSFTELESRHRRTQSTRRGDREVRYGGARADSDKRVRWRVKAGPEEWVGTDIEFSLSQQGDFTVALFGHRNWREAVEFTAHCSMKWATFMLSLRELVETASEMTAVVTTCLSTGHLPIETSALASVRHDIEAAGGPHRSHRNRDRALLLIVPGALGGPAPEQPVRSRRHRPAIVILSGASKSKRSAAR
jgi:hypothetical protein